MKRYSKSYGGYGRKPVDPTRAEIRQRCREIQQTWTPHVERTRRGAIEGVEFANVAMYWRSGVLTLMAS